MHDAAHTEFGRTPAWRMNRVQLDFRLRVIEKVERGEYRLQDVPECLCGSVRAFQVANRDRFGLPVGFVGCRDCGLVRTSPRLHPDDLSRFYEDDYHGLHMGIVEPEPSVALFRTGQGADLYAFVRDQLATEFRLAEVGCGTGQVMREFQAAAKADGRNVTAFGCELASAYVAAGRSVGSTILHGSSEVLAPHGPYDVVILSHVLEHFPNPPQQLEVLASMVRENGFVLIEVPGLTAIHTKPEYDYELLKYLTLAHTYHFSLETLTNVMARAGFGLVRGDQSVRAVFRPGSHRAWSARSGAKTAQYLEWLEKSPVVRAKRLTRRTRGFAISTLRKVAGERGVNAARQIRRLTRSRS